MSLYRSSPRITRYTLRTCPARKTAAWPAELPPPTTTTSDPRHMLRLDGGRGVVDAAPLEPLAPLDAQPAVVGPGGDQQALGRDRLAAVEVQHRVARRRTSGP